MQLTNPEFDELVRQAYEEMPKGVRASIDNLAILVEDWPSREDLESAGIRRRYQLFGLYHGVPLPDRGNYMPLLPDTVTLFKRPIELVCSTWADVVREVRITLLHEVGHYMGLDEDDLEAMGYS